jgi:hypothetical protein
MTIIISTINGVRGDKLYFNYITTVEGNNIKTKYSSVRRPPMCLYNVHILQTTPHKHFKKGLKISFQVTPLLKTLRRVRSIGGQSNGTNPKPEGTKTTINENEGSTNTNCLKKKPAFKMLHVCLNILGGDPLQISGKNPTISPPPPPCHLKCPLLIKSTTHKQISHLRPFTLHSFTSLTLPHTHPKKQRQTSHLHFLPSTPLRHSYFTLPNHRSGNKQTNLTFV